MEEVGSGKQKGGEGGTSGWEGWMGGFRRKEEGRNVGWKRKELGSGNKRMRGMGG